MIDVVYPYYHAQSAWEELKYSLRSLYAHLNEKYRVVIVGDMPPYINHKKVLWLRCKRKSSGSDISLNDVNHKIFQVLSDDRISEKVLFMYDDIYFLRSNFGDLEYKFKGVPAMHHYGDGNYSNQNSTASASWEAAKVRTLKILKHLNYEPISFETHLPRPILKSIGLEAFRQIPILQERLLRWSCIYNYVLKECGFPIDYLSKENGWKAGFYGKDSASSYYAFDEHQVAKVCESKMFLNHDNQGLNDVLKKFIIKRFPRKSPWEK